MRRIWGGWHNFQCEVFVTIYMRWLSKSTWGVCLNLQWGGCHNFQPEVVVIIYSMMWLSQWGGCQGLWEFEVVVTNYMRWSSQSMRIWDGCHKLQEESILGKSPLLRSSGQGVWCCDHVTTFMIHTHSGGARMVTQPLRRPTSWGSCSWSEGGLAVG